jgi:hypothetical protein
MKKLGKKVTAGLLAFLLAAGMISVSDRAVRAEETEFTEATGMDKVYTEVSGPEEVPSSAAENRETEPPVFSGTESTEAETPASSAVEGAGSESAPASAAESTGTDTNVSSGAEQPEGGAPAPSEPETGEHEGGSSTDAYSASLVLADEKKAFYGGEIITVYNNISVSGNLTVVPEGAYTVVSVRKNEFQKPKESEVSTSFEKFRSLEIRETEDTYQIVTSYRTIYGGYTGGTPVRLNLLPRETVNLKEYQITQEFYSADGRRLTEPSSLMVTGMSRIERLQSQNFGASRLKKEVDENYVVKAQTYVNFSVSRSYPAYNENDPRARRIWAEIPEGLTVKPETGWTWDDAAGA